jgi:hypothetical protein
MSRRRIAVFTAVFIFIVGPSLCDSVRDTEHWPWSCYPMYSEMETGTKFNDMRLYGVLKRDRQTEFSLFTDERYLQPFDQSRLAEILAVVYKRPDIDLALKNCLDRYEAMRRAGRHNGPELAGIRVYRVYWTLDPDGKTIEHPDSKVLLGEYMSPAQGKS